MGFPIRIRLIQVALTLTMLAGFSTDAAIAQTLAPIPLAQAVPMPPPPLPEPPAMCRVEYVCHNGSCGAVKIVTECPGLNINICPFEAEISIQNLTLPLTYEDFTCRPPTLAEIAGYPTEK